mmetsp:Transcript_33714/g.36329  ORF Transcript_33714/g.36329 Transcript_33714/m.36329 type:complete len:196 (-) Transcript_33714:85-672(-)
MGNHHAEDGDRGGGKALPSFEDRLRKFRHEYDNKNNNNKIMAVEELTYKQLMKAGVKNAFRYLLRQVRAFETVLCRDEPTGYQCGLRRLLKNRSGTPMLGPQMMMRIYVIVSLVVMFVHEDLATNTDVDTHRAKIKFSSKRRSSMKFVEVDYPSKHRIRRNESTMDENGSLERDESWCGWTLRTVQIWTHVMEKV